MLRVTSQVELHKYVIFTEETIQRVARRMAGAAGPEAHSEAVRYASNVAESLGAAVYRSHCLDGPGTNATACGQVWGASSQRVNTVVSSVKDAAALDRPAVGFCSTDPGLMVRGVARAGLGVVL